MELKQRTELRKLMAPQLRQSLKILTLPLLDLKGFIEDELSSNPLLEDAAPEEADPASSPAVDEADEFKPASSNINNRSIDTGFRQSLITKKASLQDILLRQLGMFANSDEELQIGREIIGNLDENGYLKANINEIAGILNVTAEGVEKTLKLIQQFEPAGIAGRTIAECLLIQLDVSNDKDPLARKIIAFHMDDVAKKNFKHIAKALKEPPDKVAGAIKKILRLDPKPGRNYSLDEAHNIIPDVTIDEKEDALKIIVNNEDIPDISINKDYRDLLKQNNLDIKTKEFLSEKLRQAVELLRAISRRQSTLRRVLEIIVEVQEEAIKNDLSCLKPLTFADVAQKLGLHESTVCRVIMNKYVSAPCGIIALKDFFPSALRDTNGESVSSSHVKGLIKELISQEDKKKPLSDQAICVLIFQRENLKLARRTVAKYREELKMLSSVFRKER